MVKRKDGRWQTSVTFTVDGCPVRRFFYGKTQQDVLRKVAAYREEEAAGVAWSDMISAWWDVHGPTLTINARRPYAAAVRRAMEAFPGRPARTVKPSDVAALLLRLTVQNHWGTHTAMLQRSVISQACRYAIAQGWLDRDPARDVDVPREARKTERRTMPADEDLGKIRAAVDTEPFGLFAYMALCTGCRRGEILGMRWEDVDLPGRVIAVQRSVCYDTAEPVLKSPKSEAGVRFVPIVDDLAAVLEKRRRAAGFLFPDTDGGPLKKTHFEARWREYSIRLGLSCSPHQLRHAFATEWIERGVEVEEMRLVLGHRYSQTTEQWYQHVREQRQKAAARRFLSLG